MPAILDFDFARPASYDPTDMVGVACVRSLASSAHPGTYVGQDGLIKLAPHNLVLWSEDWTNAAYSNFILGAGIDPVTTANAGLAPDGTMTADRIDLDCGGGTSSDRSLRRQSVTTVVGQPYAGGFWIKAATPGDIGKTVRLLVENVGSDNIYTLTGSWVRVALPSGNASSTSAHIYVECRGTYTSQSASVLIWGTQLNLGPTALDYVKTTSAANGGTRIAWGPREPYQNLLLQTTWPDAGANPTGWTVGDGSNSNTNSKWGTAAQARTFTTSASRSYLTQAFTLVSNTTYSISIRVEEVSGTVTLANILGGAGAPAGCTITGYQVDGVTFASSTQALAGTTVSITLAGTYTGAAMTVRVGNGVVSNTTGTVKLSRPNLNVGVQAYNWYPTTSTAVYVTPFDLVGNWECHGAMSEGARTNLALYSEQFDNAAWVLASGVKAFGSGSVVNATSSPDGSTTMDFICEDTSTGNHEIRQAISVTSGTKYCTSVFAKYGGRYLQIVYSSAQFGASQYATFDLQNGVVSGSAVGTASIDAVGGGVYRCSFAAPATATAGSNVYITISNAATGRGPTYTGDGSSGVYIWGAQLEAGSSPSSYIPTLGTAVTRNADAISYTLSGAHATALSSAGTAVVEYRYAGAGSEVDQGLRQAIEISDGGTGNRIRLYNLSGAETVHIVNAGVNQSFTQPTGSAVHQSGIKLSTAVRWAINNVNIACNGQPGTTDVTASMPPVTVMAFGSQGSNNHLFGTIKRVTIFDTALTDTQITAASKPVEPTAHWRTYDGTHRTASDTDKTVSCDIEADVDLDTAGENGVQRVEFYVSVNGVLSSIATQTARSERTHNSTPAGTNGFLTTWGYGITVDCSALAGGTITVDATVFSNLGAISYLPTLTIYNDTDGTDRRPSSAIVYYDYDLGDDTTGTGTFANPVKNFRAAMNLLSGDIGGATIRAKTRTIGCTSSSSYSASGWSTSGKWALTVEAVGADKTWQRLTPGTFSDPQDYILGTSGAAQVRMRFKDFEFKGPGPTLYVNGPNAQIDEVNCLVRSHKWTPADTNAHVDYEQYGSGGVDIALNGTSRGVRNSWGGQWRGVARGPAGYTSLFNFSIDKFLGIALQTSNDLGVNPLISNGELHFIRYTAGRLDGLIQTNPNFSQLAGPNVTVSVQASGPHTGKMRIEATNSTPNDFGTAAGHLVGSTRWGVTVSSATSGANNGTFAALEGGLNGFGRPYCILDNASAVGEVGSAGFNMDTGTLVGGNRYIDVIHTDGLQMYGPHVGAAFTNVRVSDCENMRSWVGSNLALTRCVLKNLSDGSHSSVRTCAFDFDNGPVILKDCIFSFLSINSNTVNFAGSFSGTNFVDVVFGNGNAVPTVGTFIHSCHFITGASPGTNPSTGAWFNTEPGVTPFDYSPSPGNRGTASGLQDAPPFWYHTGAVAASRGAWKNVATGNWSTAPTGGGSTAKIPYLGLGVRVGFL